MELKEGKEYIAKRYGNTLKIKIHEKTVTSILIENLDTKTKFRCDINEFNRDYNLIEELGGNKQLLLG